MAKNKPKKNAGREEYEEDCDFCDGTVRQQIVPKFTYYWHGQFHTFNQVPAGVCQKCGEQYLDAHTLKNLDRILLEAQQPARA